MNSGYFSVEGAASISAIPAGSHIHIIGVAGVAMAQLALLLCKLGYRVSGSDREFYEPMGSLLRASAVKLYQGYASSNIGSDVSLVVIGNVVSAGHPEALEVERRGLKYTLFPKLLFELIIGARHSIVISGTHGKTTTSAMAAFVLRSLGLEPSYFIGGAALDFSSSLERGNGAISVVEGDEYDSAFFAKVPKFSFYHPQTLVVTAIEYDHADIYPDLAAIKREFDRLVQALPPTGQAICCIDDQVVRAMAASWSKSARGKIVTYGVEQSAAWRIEKLETHGLGQSATVICPEGQILRLELGLPGVHNMRNAVAVLAAARSVNLDPQTVTPVFKRFRGVKRRQQLVFDRDELRVIEDFAHHPTAVRETVAAVKRAFPKSRLWAVFEPRSNTSRKKVFQQEYVAAFKEADLTVLCDVEARSGDSSEDLIDVPTLAQAISASSKAALCLPNPAAICDYLSSELRPGDVALIMSNGAFGGLISALVARLEKIS